MDQIRPDVLIADQFSATMMLDVVGAATSRFQTRIVILTDDDISPHHAGLIRDLGVLAILGRDATPREVQAAVRCASVGKPYGRKSELQGRTSSTFATSAQLDSAELRMLKILSTGATKKQISEFLELRETVVKYRLAKMYHRLGVRNRWQAIEKLSAPTLEAELWRAKILLAAAVGHGTKNSWRSRRARLPDAVKQAVLAKTMTQMPANATHWSRSSMAAEIGISPSSVGRIWAEAGIKPQLTRRFKVSE